MRVCGVELVGSEAIICLLSLSEGLFDLPDCRVRRMPITEAVSQQGVKGFQFAFAKLMEDYKIERVVIRERATKGKYAGSAISFKLEAAIQLIDSLDVEVMAPSAIKGSIARTPLPVRFGDTGLKPFQEAAFLAAYANLAWVDAPE